MQRFLTAYDDHQQANGGPLLDYYGVFLLNTKYVALVASIDKAFELTCKGRSGEIATF